ncbi:transmembrane protein, putative (macronuclear) [Tetrahymena thermophila SB210]|uniref:Transmembrane protein, putative n=1 Tax=Tetrahymena thermophila (strain SB210) TaxID=312017 RepID=Q22H13_TETTS|nr:transmembrane protein, putative [Tetrahymena thermophila SB210]EAR84511.3 transmembrane protein, putative [Tetrahymena thermophila SB210]|eukprot:XP_001032174.3 transmembrane protein, putative [Tetrahymena thermophila SB210]
MLFAKFDLFSQPFLFNLNNNQFKKGTIQGLLLSLGIIGAILAYFIYLTYLFFANKIDPIFRSQNFVTNELIEVPLHEDLVAFKFIESPQYTLEQFQKKMNQTYIIPIATFGFQSQNGYNITFLNITECTNPDLYGYNCLDFSTLANSSLLNSIKNNIFSVITILFYPCPTIDNIKTFAPDNCASQSDIDNFADGAFTSLRLKMFTQQYNTTSKQTQANFKNFQMFPQSDQYILNRQYVQNQITKVKDGFLIQSETEYNAPISYSYENQYFPNDQNPYIQVSIQIEEVIYQTSIQFSTFPSILALVNSAFSLLMFLGIFCRKFANKSILQDFFCVFLQNMHQNLYEEVLKQNNLFQSNSYNTQIETQQNKLIIGQELTEREVFNSLTIPNFITKSREYIEQSQQLQINTTQNEKDEIIESEEGRMQSQPDQQKNNQQFQFKNQAINQNKQIQNYQINEDSKFDNNNLLASSRSDIRNSNEQTYREIFNNSSRRQTGPHRLSIFQNCNQNQQRDVVHNLHSDYNISQKPKIEKTNPIQTQEINLNLSQQNQNIQQSQSQSCQQQDSIKIKTEENKMNEQKKKKMNTIEYYTKKLKVIQDINIFKKFTSINFGYWFSIQKRLKFFKICKKKSEEQEQKKLSLQQKTFIEQQVLRRTIQVLLLSLGIIGAIIAYFIYLAYLFYGNKIDPIFRSQNFFTNELIDVPFHEDLVASRFIHNPNQTLEQLEQEMKKTYIVPIASFAFQSQTGYIYTLLNISKCSNPDLYGYYYLDFSTLANSSLMISINNNIFSVIVILFYPCPTKDNIKTFVPDNCASQNDIDIFANDEFTSFRLKLFTQQYNTTSKQNKVNFKNFQMFPQSDQYILNRQYLQSKIAKGKDSFLMKSESECLMKINQQNPYIQVSIQIEEVIQQTSIQFSTFPQILALANSAQFFDIFWITLQKISKQVNSVGFYLRLLVKYALKSLRRSIENEKDEIIEIEEVINQNKQNQNQQINEDSKFDNNNLLASSRSDIRNSNEQTYLENFNISSRGQIGTFRQNLFQICNQNQQRDVVQNVPAENIVFQKQKIEKINPKENQEINLNFSQQNQNIQQNQSKSCQQQDSIKIKTEQNNKSEQLKKKMNTIEYYIKKLKVIQDINIFKKFTSINFGYWFSIYKRLKFFKICKKKSEEQEQKQLSLQQKTQNQDKRGNYFESQIDILDSTELSCQYIKKFILKCANSKNTQIETQQNKLIIGQEFTERRVHNSFTIPNFITKSREYIEKSQNIQINNAFQNGEDEVIESEEYKKQQQPDQQKNSYSFEFENNVINQNQQINEDSKFDKNNLLASSRSDIKISNEQSYLYSFNSTQRRQIGTFEQNTFQNFNQNQERDIVQSVPAENNVFQKQKVQIVNPKESQEINLNFSQKIQKIQQSQSNSYRQEDSIKIKVEKNKMNEQIKIKMNTIEYYTKNLKVIQDINVFKKFTSINFGYWFSIQKRLKIFKICKKKSKKAELIIKNIYRIISVKEYEYH